MHLINDTPSYMVIRSVSYEFF